MSDERYHPDPEVLPPEDEALVKVGELREDRLLGFYDRLRDRVVAAAERGRLPRAALEVLMLAPDLFVLMLRVVLDRRTPRGTRQLVGGALLYFLAPIDFMPEALFGVGGFLDDVTLAAAVLSHLLSSDLEPLVRGHWSGRAELRTALAAIAEGAEGLLGEGLYGRVRSWLAKRGVDPTG